MKKNLKVIQIRGFRGLFLALFIISCLVAGFVAFPALLSMNIWNYMGTKITTLPQINFLQGLLLWAIIALSVFIFNNRKFIVSFNAEQELSEAEVKEVITRIKNQSFEKQIFVPKDLNIKDLNIKKTKEDAEEISKNNIE